MLADAEAIDLLDEVSFCIPTIYPFSRQCTVDQRTESPPTARKDPVMILVIRVVLLSVASLAFSPRNVITIPNPDGIKPPQNLSDQPYIPPIQLFLDSKHSRVRRDTDSDSSDDDDLSDLGQLPGRETLPRQAKKGINYRESDVSSIGGNRNNRYVTFV